MKNYMKLEIAALGVNEGFARSAVAAFALPLSPSLVDLEDVKTAVSEAVTNSIVHAYKGQNAENKILIECSIESLEEGLGGDLHIKITDYGCGIEDVEKAIAPFFTTLADEERSGMGFTIMQTFCDGFTLQSTPLVGTTVYLRKRLGGERVTPPCEVGKKEGLNA